jgi:hypothetical protein
LEESQGTDCRTAGIVIARDNHKARGEAEVMLCGSARCG